jgi:hypothetical protein
MVQPLGLTLFNFFLALFLHDLYIGLNFILDSCMLLYIFNESSNIFLDVLIISIITLSLSKFTFHHLNYNKKHQQIILVQMVMLIIVGVSTPGGSLDRRVNCRRVSQPRWVGARRSTKGGNKETGVKEKPAAFVFVLRPGRVRLQ